MAKGKKGRNGTKKYGRNAKKCEKYKAAGRRAENKARKALKHKKRHPNDN